MNTQTGSYDFAALLAANNYTDQSTVTLASNSVAVYRSQTIYISKDIDTESVQQNNIWTDDVTGDQNTWTSTRPEYNSSYPVLFTARQTQTVSQYNDGLGACSCTTPVRDLTMVVIDGANIIAGSINAEKIATGAVTTSKLNIGEYMTFDYQKKLLESEPADWTTNWTNYYRAGTYVDEYVKITEATDPTCPTWTTDTFYYLDLSDPQIIIGKKSSYGVVIDNTQVTFWYANMPVAYISREKMVIPESVMLDEMIVGHDDVINKDLWSWQKHDKNLCLKWLGG